MDKIASVLGHPNVLDRMISAWEKVDERRNHAVYMLQSANIEYAMIGGNAVAAWVKTIDAGGIRGTPSVDILVRREDSERAESVLIAAGLPVGKGRSDVRLWYAGEKVKEDYFLPMPELDATVVLQGMRVLTLEALVQTKLVAFRTIDKVHLGDMIEVGLVDETWCERYPKELSERLHYLIENPENEFC
jgi:hypothetical protein